MAPTSQCSEHPPLSMSALALALSNPWTIESFSPVGSHPLLLVDTRPDVDDDDALAQCIEWLPRLPCPVIGIGLSGPLAPYTDTNVTSVADARTLLNNIRSHPLPAMTLMQLLRHNQDASVDQGLLAESLAYSTLQGGADFQDWLARQPGRPTPTVEQNAVLSERRADTLHITLNRPQARNAFSREMRDQLTEALYLLTMEPQLQRAIISGAGACFSVGGDLTEFGSYGDPASAHAIRATRNVGRLIDQHRQRIECRLHRACIGAGIELPAFAGRVVATPNSFFQLPELSMGLIPGAGGTMSILRRIGRQRTAWLALSGKRINASRALDWGLIDAIEPHSSH